MHLWPGYAHAYIAQEKGFFKEEGVEVELNLIEGVEDNLEHFREGNADAAFGLQSDAMLLSAQGIPLHIMYVADFSNGGDVIISKLEITTIRGLKGRRVSVDKLNGFNHIFLVELLRLNGLTEDDVTVVPVPASKVLAALDTGKIDAGQTWEPYQSQALAKGYRLLASTRDAPGIVTDVLMSDSDLFARRPEDVRKIVKCLFRALRFRTTNENEAYAIMSKAFKMSPGSLKKTIQGNIFPGLAENNRAFEKTEDSTSLFRTGRIISDFFLVKGVIQHPVDLNKLHSREALL
ncbi:MAG: ABC transporter substrate-binding protein [Myxococcales bacterium]|nr:ABC transporter substrate-binding protein [Myxococcales bacterium]